MATANNRSRADPTNLDSLNKALAVPDPEGKLNPIRMDRIEIGPEALDVLTEMVSSPTRSERVVLVAEVEEAIDRAGCVVSVDSGTITDLYKMGSKNRDDVPFVAVQSAGSVNGFSDDFSVLLKRSPAPFSGRAARPPAWRSDPRSSRGSSGTAL